MLSSIKAFVFNLAQRVYTSVKTFALAHKVWAATILTLVIIGGSIAGRLLFSGTEQVVTEALDRKVTLENVGILSSSGTSLTTVGTITSEAQATVLAEKGGKVTRVMRKLGDRISAGSIIAEIDSASERASLLSAQGALDAAQANLRRVTGGSRDEQKTILGASKDSATAALESTRESTVNTLLATYASVENAIRVTADSMISNPSSAVPQFSVPTSQSQIELDIENARIGLNATLTRQTTAGKTLTSRSDLATELTTTEAELRTLLTFFDKIITALNSALPTTNVSSAAIAAYQASASGARAGIVSSLSGLNAAREAIATRQNALTIAEQTLSQGVTGGDKNDIASAQAAVKQAQGALAQASAAYEKSIIRAPISGTINAFSLTKGDFVQAFSPAATIANNGTLEISTFVTDSDARLLRVGGKVSIEGGAEGVITRMGAGVDPLTKKVEVRVAVTKGAAALVNGSAAILTFTEKPAATKIAQRITIPITALRITADGESIFTVEDNKLIEQKVTIGTLLGDRVEIRDGLTLDTYIVTDVRGLRPNQIVTVE